ncbi:hypothetical protein ACFSC6_17220 [Rufibacter sediminis]|uniref:STAS/SEC14 domain-containing protein n=1 Tax=Rufibacter sediminis TaxID=2762756 RepID=A0ABR6VUX4_9BACT|nr:hypothetical protein [Rufibacter sediminis]MBC3541008.1 hypothetical protein [Rufibacter sediminis]
MILYQNGLIQLEYQPSTDILRVTLPNAQHIGLTELQRSLDTIAGYIQSYDVKNLLLNSSNTVLHDLDDTAYREMVVRFFTDLKRTRLQRIARIGTSSAAHEMRSAVLTSALEQEMITSFILESFPNEGVALQWLQEEK